MRVGIIGAGRVGCSLAIGFKRKGHDIAGVFSKSPESVQELAEHISGHFDNDLKAAVNCSELIFITVPDTSIRQAASEIVSSLEPSEIKGKVFFHCSGALESGYLNDIEECGGLIGSLHPIQTFASKTEGWKGLDNIYFGYEGSEEALQCANAVVDIFNGSLLRIKKEDKPVYHAAACIISNYTVTLSYLAGNLLEKIGIQPEAGSKAFMPLLKNTVSNIEALGSLKALTGPVSRGDSEVVAGHLRALNDKCPEAVDAYRTLACATLELASKNGRLTGDKLNQLFNILK